MFNFKIRNKGQGCSSVMQCRPGKYEILSSSSSIKNGNKNSEYKYVIDNGAMETLIILT